MRSLNYWTFPVAYGQCAVLINTTSTTSLTLMEQAALPHFLTQLECARSFCEPVIFEDAPAKPKRRGRKGPRQAAT